MSDRKRRILFIDRDGTLITEPADEQVDSLEKLELVPGVVPALLELAGAGYEFVIVSNQDGLGTDAYPVEDFEIPQQKMLDIFSSQGITFSGILIDEHFEHENSPNRKPGIGMVLDYLKSGELISIFEEYRYDYFPVWLVYPNTRYVSAKVRMFIDFFTDNIIELSEIA